MTAVIIKDTIVITPIEGPVYNVTALVTESSRETAVPVTVQWNSDTGSEVLQTALIAAYNETAAGVTAVLQAQVRDEIGSTIPTVDTDTGTDTSSAVSSMTINATNVTVLKGGT